MYTKSTRKIYSFMVIGMLLFSAAACGKKNEPDMMNNIVPLYLFMFNNNESTLGAGILGTRKLFTAMKVEKTSVTLKWEIPADATVFSIKTESAFSGAAIPADLTGITADNAAIEGLTSGAEYTFTLSSTSGAKYETVIRVTPDSRPEILAHRPAMDLVNDYTEYNSKGYAFKDKSILVTEDGSKWKFAGEINPDLTGDGGRSSFSKIFRAGNILYAVNQVGTICYTKEALNQDASLYCGSAGWIVDSTNSGSGFYSPVAVTPSGKFAALTQTHTCIGDTLYSLQCQESTQDFWEFSGYGIGSLTATDDNTFIACPIDQFGDILNDCIRSTDGGITWTDYTNVPESPETPTITLETAGAPAFYRIARAPVSGNLIAVSSSGIHLSADQGVTWTKPVTSTAYQQLVTYGPSSEVFYAVPSFGNPQYTADGGATWQEVTFLNNGATCPTSKSIRLVFSGDGTNPPVFVNSNGVVMAANTTTKSQLDCKSTIFFSDTSAGLTQGFFKDGYYYAATEDSLKRIRKISTSDNSVSTVVTIPSTVSGISINYTYNLFDFLNGWITGIYTYSNPSDYGLFTKDYGSSWSLMNAAATDGFRVADVMNVTNLGAVVIAGNKGIITDTNTDLTTGKVRGGFENLIIQSVAQDNDYFYAVGYDGLIARFPRMTDLTDY